MNHEDSCMQCLIIICTTKKDPIIIQSLEPCGHLSTKALFQLQNKLLPLQNGFSARFKRLFDPRLTITTGFPFQIRLHAQKPIQIFIL